MGNFLSTQTRSRSPPPSPPLQSRPWRDAPPLDSKNLLELKAKVEYYRLPPNLNATQARILMLGPVKAGKSSFFKTINSIFQERITQPTATGTATGSLTMTYRQFQVRSRSTGRPLNFRLCDTRGLESKGRPDLVDLNYLLEGNVPDGHHFVNAILPTMQGFIHQPGFQDKVHCVVFVFEASTVKLTDEGIWKKLTELQTLINTKDIPRIVLLTKIDRISEALTDDVSPVFLSKDVRRAVEYVSHKLGIPPGNVMPIKNYESGGMLNNSTSCLALQALDLMLGYAYDYLVNQNDLMSQEIA